MCLFLLCGDRGITGKLVGQVRALCSSKVLTMTGIKEDLLPKVIIWLIFFIFIVGLLIFKKVIYYTYMAFYMPSDLIC